jgi:hypothetical protein
VLVPYFVSSRGGFFKILVDRNRVTHLGTPKSKVKVRTRITRERSLLKVTSHPDFYKKHFTSSPHLTTISQMIAMDKLSSLHRVPQSPLECINPNTGEFDIDLFLLYRRRSEFDESFEEFQATIEDDDDEDDDYDIANDSNCSNAPRRKKSHGVKERREQRIYRCPLDGKIKPLGPKNTPWFMEYVESPNITSPKFQRKFRRRFRMAYASFIKHLGEVKGSHYFQSWRSDNSDCVGRQCSHIELLLLGTLRYLGRGWTLDDLEEQTMICEEVHRRFLHAYISWGATDLYQRYVVTPANKDEVTTNSAEYHIAGLPGCLGSQDATHIGMHRCQYRLRQYHNSYKLPMPTRTYNLTVNHRRRILSSTRGHPGRWNDKTLVLYDSLSTDLRDGKRYSDIEFELLERDPVTNDIKAVRYTGAWLIVDNGYLSWSMLIPPITNPSTWQEFRFSKWIESIRKDVECTFGILKCRFAVLKRGITLHGIEATDKIWLTCCALHNFLLDEDGLDVSWDEFQGMEVSEAAQHQEIDNSGMGRGNDGVRVGIGVNDENLETDSLSAFNEGADDENSISEPPCQNPLAPVKVWKLTRAHFRDRLVENFHIRWTRNEVVWPSRTGLGQQPNIE